MDYLFMFGGQGSQLAGMGRDFYRSEPLAREIYEQAFARYPDLRQLLDEDFARIDETRFAQPAILLFSQVVTELLRQRHVVPAGAIGLSAGEYAALYALGSWTQEQSLDLIEGRAALMSERLRTRRESGRADGMMAVLGLTEAEMLAFLDMRQQDQEVYLSNINDRKQIVLGGSLACLRELEPQLLEAGAGRCIFLDVEGAFHTPIFTPDVAELRSLLQLNPPRLPQGFLPLNCTGRVLSPGDSQADLIEIMAGQMASPVRLNDCLEEVLSRSFDCCVEISAKPVLQPIVKRRDRALKTAVISSHQEMLDFLAAQTER